MTMRDISRRLDRLDARVIDCNTIRVVLQSPLNRAYFRYMGDCA